MTKYTVAFGRDNSTYTVGATNLVDYTVIGVYNTLKLAGAARKLSGDLVFDENKQIVQDKSWLFTWEKESNKGYAQNCIKAKTSLLGNPLTLL